MSLSVKVKNRAMSMTMELTRFSKVKKQMTLANVGQYVYLLLIHKQYY